jgi:hypothetical protein
MHRQDGFDNVILPNLPTIPGMLSSSECRYYYWLTSVGYSGAGAVVELGTWLGKSTIHLAAGIRDSAYPGRLYCYDSFAWTAQMNKVATERGFNQKIAIGESFQPIFEANIAPVYDNIKVTKTNTQDIKWENGPIEILILDASPKFEDYIATMQIFGPHLIPGVSQIAFHYFLHYSNYDTSMLLSGMHSDFFLSHITDKGRIATFTVKKRLCLDSKQAEELNFRKWNVDFAISTWQKLYKQIQIPALQEILEVHLCLYLYDLGLRRNACSRIRQIRFTNRILFKNFSKDKRLYMNYGDLFWALGCQQQPRWSYPLWKIREFARKFKTLKRLVQLVRRMRSYS